MSFVGIASEAYLENPTGEAKRLKKEIEGWVFKKVEKDIKGSGL